MLLASKHFFPSKNKLLEQKQNVYCAEKWWNLAFYRFPVSPYHNSQISRNFSFYNTSNFHTPQLLPFTCTVSSVFGWVRGSISQKQLKLYVSKQGVTRTVYEEIKNRGSIGQKPQCGMRNQCVCRLQSRQYFAICFSNPCY